jgi:hypothetical protein
MPRRALSQRTEIGKAGVESEVGVAAGDVVLEKGVAHFPLFFR